MTITFEGIENATAGALAFASDIRAGTTTVVAALSASGVKNFQPWPASTTAVVVAADRDEGVGPDGIPRDKVGEDAARELCMRVRDHTNFAGIALPGSPGEKVDWLDILRRDSIDALLTGIYAAVRFKPTTEELEQVVARRSRDAELAEIAAAYPLPRMHTPHLTYAHTADGKVKVHKVFGSGDEMKLIPIATPFGVLARLRHADQANAYGLRCVVQDMDGEQRAVDFRRGSLQKMGATDIREMLFNTGLRTEADGDAVASSAQSSGPGARDHRCVATRLAPDRRLSAFDRRAPDGTAIGALDGVTSNSHRRFASHRTSRRQVRKRVAGCCCGCCIYSDCLHWTLGVRAGFAGVLVSLAGFNSCGINLSGRSTSGNPQRKSSVYRFGRHPTSAKRRVCSSRPTRP